MEQEVSMEKLSRLKHDILCYKRWAVNMGEEGAERKMKSAVAKYKLAVLRFNRAHIKLGTSLADIMFELENTKPNDFYREEIMGDLAKDFGEHARKIRRNPKYARQFAGQELTDKLLEQEKDDAEKPIHFVM